jgi:hypothetical protein
MFNALQRIVRRDAGQFLLGVLFIVSIVVSFPRVYATDEVQYYSWVRSLWFDHDVDFENEYHTFAERNPNSGITTSLLMPNRIRPITGLYGNIAPVGSAILWSPWFIGADLGLRAVQSFGLAREIPADGYSWPYQRAICYASAFYAWIGLLIVHRMTKRWTTARNSTIATVGMWFATPLIFYMTVQMPFAHANAFFVCAVFVRSWLWQLDNPQRWEPWVAVGASLGALFMVREQLILFGVLPAVSTVYTLWTTRDSLRTTIIQVVPRVLMGAITVATFALPQFVAYTAVNGEPKPASEVSSKLNWCSPHAIDTLIDFDPTPEPLCRVASEPIRIPAWSRGAFVWSPILVLGVFGLMLFAVRYPLYGIPMLCTVAAQIWLNGAFGTTWHLSGAFGFRRYIECTPFFVIGAAYLLNSLPTQRWNTLATVLIVLLIGWNLGLILNGTVFNALTGVRRGLQWPELWYWQFSLPQRLWELGGTFFDRCRVLKNGC